MTADDRERLGKALTKCLPGMESSEWRSMFLLMLAVLCDHRELELARQMDAQSYLEQLKSIEGSLRRVAEQMDSPVCEKIQWQ